VTLDADAPRPSHRLIPSQYPPIGLFDTVARAADLVAVMELAGWTNDRLVDARLYRLPENEWVFGRANSSIVMAAFLHVAPAGSRFNGPDLGAWYASAEMRTAAAEVGHHLRREAVARRVPGLKRTYRSYRAHLDGRFRDVRGDATLHASDSYEASQKFGEAERKAGGDGIIFDSVRHAGGVNIVAYRPSKVLAVTQADHFEIAVLAEERRIEVTKLEGG
jgi:hypothetical protein